MDKKKLVMDEFNNSKNGLDKGFSTKPINIFDREDMDSISLSKSAESVTSMRVHEDDSETTKRRVEIGSDSFHDGSGIFSSQITGRFEPLKIKFLVDRNFAIVSILDKKQDELNSQKYGRIRDIITCIFTGVDIEFKDDFDKSVARELFIVVMTEHFNRIFNRQLNYEVIFSDELVKEYYNNLYDPEYIDSVLDKYIDMIKEYYKH